MRIKHILLLIAILTLGAVLHLNHLANNPRILNKDEASIAYNAYLLSRAGVDEWGKSWPLTFRAFGGQTTSLGYIYFLVPLFSLLNPTDFLVRAPAALAGMINIYLVYLMGKKVFKSGRSSLLAALTFTVLPSMIFYSRIANEANLGLLSLLISLCLLFFTGDKTIKNRTRFDIIAFMAIVISVATLGLSVFYLPFVTAFLVLFRGVKNVQKWLLPVFLLSVAFLIGVLTQQPEIQMVNGGLSPSLLISSGKDASLRYSHLYWSVYFSAAAGIFLAILRIAKQLIKDDLSLKMKYVLLLLGLFIMPLASVLMMEGFEVIDLLVLSTFTTLFAIYGATSISKLTKAPQLILLVFIAVLSFEASTYFNDYFIEYPAQQSALKPGFDIVVQEIDEKLSETEVTVVADGYQYIYAAWYLKMPPDYFFETITREGPDTVGLYSGTKVGQFKFVKDESELQADEELVIFWDSQDNSWRFLEINDEAS